MLVIIPQEMAQKIVVSQNLTHCSTRHSLISSQDAFSIKQRTVYKYCSLRVYAQLHFLGANKVCSAAQIFSLSFVLPFAEFSKKRRRIWCQKHMLYQRGTQIDLLSGVSSSEISSLQLIVTEQKILVQVFLGKGGQGPTRKREVFAFGLPLFSIVVESHRDFLKQYFIMFKNLCYLNVVDSLFS